MITSKTALLYLSKGFSVIPVHTLARKSCTCGREDCPTPGKHPRIAWAEYAERLPTKDEVVSWFDDEFYGSNIGTVTGSISNLLVVDLDAPEGLKSIRKELRVSLQTLIARTGGGCWHLFYRLDGAVVPSRNRAFPMVDIKSERGFVVLPPSKHKSGSQYRWIRLMPKGYLAISELIPKMPTVETSAGWYADLLNGVEEGLRSDVATRLAGRYASLGLSLQEMWLIMVAWNERNRPPLSGTDLKTTVKFVHRKQREANNDVAQLAKALRDQEEEG